LQQSKRKIAPPPAKKAKKEPKKPFIFKGPSLLRDIYFKVFDQEFHVNSSTLKLQSGFFRAFLDPSGG
jgi:hypothetical protein